MRPRRTSITAASLTAACVLAIGCMSLERMAPPVDDELTSVGARQGAAADALARGRAIYLSKCVKCHTVEPIDRYSIAKWQKVLPDMSEESKLTPPQRDELWAYILAAHEKLTAEFGKPTKLSP